MGKPKVPSAEDVARGKRLEQALAAAGMNQSELAAKTGVKPSTVGRWLTGSDPRGVGWQRIAEVLGNVKPDWIVFGAGAPPNEGHRRVVVVTAEPVHQGSLSEQTTDAVFAVLDDPRVAPVESEERAELRQVAPGFASRFGARETVEHLVRWLLGHRLERKGKHQARAGFGTSPEDAERAELAKKQRELEDRGIVIQAPGKPTNPKSGRGR